MSRTVQLFARTTGLNNLVDSPELNANPKTGETELAQAVNADISDRGKISRRLGQERISASNALTCFCDKGDCFVVINQTSDAAIYQVGTDFSFTGVISGLTKDVRPGFCQVGSRTYYSSAYQNGFIEEGIRYPWPLSTHLGATTGYKYYPAPLGAHIAYFDGHMLIAKDTEIWISEKYEVGKFRMAKNYFKMGTNVRMVKPVLGGLWVSDEEKTGFVPAGEGDLARAPFIKKASVPAHEWSENIELVDLSKTALAIPGLSAVWSSDEGMCVGSENGQLTVVTENALLYPTGSTGATVVRNDKAINSVW